MFLIKKIKLLSGLLMLMLILVYGCTTTSTYFNGTWKNPAYQGKKFNKILILAVHNELIVRSLMEKSLASSLKDYKINTVKASDFIDFNKLEKGEDGKLTDKSKAYFKDMIKNNNIDAGIIFTLKDIKESEHYVPGSTAYVPYGGYYGFYGNFYSSYNYVETPGYMQKTKQVFLISNLYDAATEELLWSGQSETSDPSSLSDFAASYSAAISNELVSSGILK